MSKDVLGRKRCTVKVPQSFSPSILLFYLVGNKNEDPTRKQVDTQDALRFGESVGVRVFETSAKENINVEEVSWKSAFLHWGSRQIPDGGVVGGWGQSILITSLFIVVISAPTFHFYPQMFMEFTHMVLRAKKQSQIRTEKEREREKDTVHINSHRDRERRKRGKKCC